MSREKREDLIGPMLGGDKVLPAAVPASADGATQRVLALVLLLVCFGAAGWVWSLGS